RPQDREELFNLWHAQACNVIEHIFGVVKRHFDLMVASPEYSTIMQAKFIAALGALHNFIWIHDPSDHDEDEVNDPNQHQNAMPEQSHGQVSQQESSR
ncbi:hypothetical protein NEOLEDRAFT_1080905, partial [Neolentinus lepideus HHB14362 ss-1]